MTNVHTQTSCLLTVCPVNCCRTHTLTKSNKSGWEIDKRTPECVLLQELLCWVWARQWNRQLGLYTHSKWAYQSVISDGQTVVFWEVCALWPLSRERCYLLDQFCQWNFGFFLLPVHSPFFFSILLKHKDTHTQAFEILVVFYLQNQQGFGHCVWERRGGSGGVSVWLGIDSVWHWDRGGRS